MLWLSVKLPRAASGDGREKSGGRMWDSATIRGMKGTCAGESHPHGGHALLAQQNGVLHSRSERAIGT
ncbi:hypothetical protein [Brevibacillus brevis]|uniref:hypothetical protein n=1 Tax=Brevibacillus brevis TaxID=1393 RepID=UPI0025A544B1|nr:hypothetical protein [Brevibacillus brevis]WJQ79820.1 hypothetical protein QN310_20345 [Brevibacillus brevis]